MPGISATAAIWQGKLAHVRFTLAQRRQLAHYLQHFCPVGWRAVQTGQRAAPLHRLTAVEKAAIYYYSDDGYEALNRQLHTSGGDNHTLFGRGLVAALAKLPPYMGEVYSGVQLSPAQVQFYRARAQDGQPVSWPAFLSASQKDSIARQFLHFSEKNCLFVIESRTGRRIEEIAKHGVEGQNEYEVVFSPNTRFEVLAVSAEPDHTRIVLDEL